MAKLEALAPHAVEVLHMPENGDGARPVGGQNDDHRR